MPPVVSIRQKRMLNRKKGGILASVFILVTAIESVARKARHYHDTEHEEIISGYLLPIRIAHLLIPCLYGVALGLRLARFFLALLTLS